MGDKNFFLCFSYADKIFKARPFIHMGNLEFRKLKLSIKWAILKKCHGGTLSGNITLDSNNHKKKMRKYSFFYKFYFISLILLELSEIKNPWINYSSLKMYANGSIAHKVVNSAKLCVKEKYS